MILFKTIKINKLVKSLNDANPDVSQSSAEELVKIGKPAVKALFIAGVKSSVYKSSVKELLIKIGESSIDTLIKFLIKPHRRLNDYSQLLFTTEVLGEIGDIRAVEPLIEVLKNKMDTTEVLYVVKALGKIGDSRAVKSLLTVAVNKGNSTYDNMYWPAYEALENIGITAVPSLIEALKDTDNNIKWYAIMILEVIGKPAVKLLIEALKNTSKDVRKGAVMALEMIKDDHAVEPLISAMNDSSVGVRMAIIRALGSIKDTRAVEPLIEALKDTSEDIRKGASKALGVIKDTRAVEPLIEVLKDTNESVRESVVWTLGNIEDIRAIEPLINIMECESRIISQSAAQALKKIEIRAIELLVEGWNDTDREMSPLIAALKMDLGEFQFTINDADSKIFEIYKESTCEIRRWLIKQEYYGKVSVKKIVENLYLFQVQADNKFGAVRVLDESRLSYVELEWVLEPEYKKFKKICGDTYLIQAGNDKYGIIYFNEDYYSYYSIKWLLELKYDTLEEIVEEFGKIIYRIRLGNKFGLICFNSEDECFGGWLLEPVYDSIKKTDFLWEVEHKKKFGLVTNFYPNSSDEFFLEPVYESVRVEKIDQLSFGQSVLRIKAENKFGLMFYCKSRNQCRWIVKTEYEEIEKLDRGIYRVKSKYNKYGLIHYKIIWKYGVGYPDLDFAYDNIEWLFELKYDLIEKIAGDARFFRAKCGNKIRLIEAEGGEIQPPHNSPDEITSKSMPDGFYRVKFGVNYGVLVHDLGNRIIRWLIDPEYDDVSVEKLGYDYYKVKAGNKYGIIDYSKYKFNLHHFQDDNHTYGLVSPNDGYYLKYGCRWVSPNRWKGGDLPYDEVEVLYNEEVALNSNYFADRAYVYCRVKSENKFGLVLCTRNIEDDDEMEYGQDPKHEFQWIIPLFYNITDLTVFREKLSQHPEYPLNLSEEWVKKGSDNNGTYSQKILIDKIKNGFKNLKGADLSGADISDVDLSGADLRDANLRGANLYLTRLIFTDLRGADLSETILERHNDRYFNNTKIEKTNFKNSIAPPLWVKKGLDDSGTYSQNILIGNIKNGFKSLSGANLRGADLSGADLSGANFWDANFVRACFSGANLSGADFSDGGSFWSADLIQADLSGANLKKADLRRADLREADLNGSDLSGAYFYNTKIENASFKNTIAPEWVKKGLDDSGTYSQNILIDNIKNGFKNLSGAYLNEADLSGADLSDADLREANLIRADLRDANLNGAYLNGADLRSADLNGSDLGEAYFKKTNDIENANFKNSIAPPEWVKKGLDENGVFRQVLLIKAIKNGFKKLSGAYLRGANLSGADLSGADLGEVNFRNTTIENANFKNSISPPEWVKKGLDNKGIYLQNILIDKIKNGFKNLRGAVLRRADLCGTDLRGADLRGADLSGTTFRDADLRGANLSETHIGIHDGGREYYLRYTTIENANFKNSRNPPEWVKKGLDNKGIYLQKTLIDNIKNGFKNLSGANLSGADLSGVDLSGADLDRANFSGSNLNGVDLSGADLWGVDLSGVDLSGVDLSGVDLSEASLDKADLNS